MYLNHPKSPSTKVPTNKFGTFFAGMVQLLEKEKDFDFKLTNPEKLVTLTKKILQVFADIEGSLLMQKTLKGETTRALPTLTVTEKAPTMDLGAKNRYFAYFLLSTSGEEFHNMFLKFYHQFDTDYDFIINEFEFKDMLNFFCKKENVGREKIEKLFKKLFPGTYQKCSKLDKILDKTEEYELGVSLSNGVFQQLEINDEQSSGLVRKRKPGVEYLKMLPLLTALYSQLISVRISKRKENLETIRGVDDDEDKSKIISESSLCDKFERLGIIYDKDDPTILTYRDVENALILFKNYYTSFGQQQLNLVLTDVQQKYKYSRKRGDFIKPPVLNKKFLTYLAFKVSIHGICHSIKNSQNKSDRFAIIQEFIYWNIVIHADKFTRSDLSRKFNNFVLKNQSDDKEIGDYFSDFIVKIIPLIPRQVGQNVLDKYAEAFPGSNDTNHFASRLYDLLIEQANLKLEEYLNSTWDKVSKHTIELILKEERERAQAQAAALEKAKHGTKLSQDSEGMNKMTSKIKGDGNPNGSYMSEMRPERDLQDISLERGGKQSVIHPHRVEGEFGGGSVYENSHMMYQHSRSIARASEVPSVPEMRHEMRGESTKLTIPFFENVDVPKESWNFERSRIKEKSLTNLDKSRSQLVTDREGNINEKFDAGQHPDYLNSCFIMETFLHNFLYEKSGGGVKKKSMAPNNDRRTSVMAPNNERRTSVISKEPLMPPSGKDSVVLASGRESIRQSRRQSKISQVPGGELGKSQDSKERNSSPKPRHAPVSYAQAAIAAKVRRDNQVSQEQHREEESIKASRPTNKPEFKFKRNSFDALKDELGNFEEFNADDIRFTKKDLNLAGRDKCTCNVF